jgi:adenine-specific DNA-methyltransferase
VLTREAVTSDKLRGGFYSPDPLVDLCWRRVAALATRRANLTVLEPSIGDGAFVRGLGRLESISRRVARVTGIEIVPAEAARAKLALNQLGLAGQVHQQSALAWYLTSAESDFDVAVGNPPYMRFQFLSDDDKDSATGVMEQLGIPRSGVANLWIPLLLGALERLRNGPPSRLPEYRREPCARGWSSMEREFASISFRLARFPRYCRRWSC